MTPAEIARRRIIDRLDLSNGTGVIVANGKTFEITFDDLLDLSQAVEMIMLKLTGKLLREKFRPTVRSRAGIVPTRLIGGDASLYDGTQGPAPQQAVTVCDVTGRDITTHYLLVEIDGSRWDNWFCRLDELVKCLNVIVREAQGDPYVPRPAIVVPGMVGHG